MTKITGSVSISQMDPRSRIRAKCHGSSTLFLTLFMSSDVEYTADDVAGVPVWQHLRSLGGGAVEAMHPLHSAQGLRPRHCVSFSYCPVSVLRIRILDPVPFCPWIPCLFDGAVEAVHPLRPRYCVSISGSSLCSFSTVPGACLVYRLLWL
jgi:hypothetical protein